VLLKKEPMKKIYFVLILAIGLLSSSCNKKFFTEQLRAEYDDFGVSLTTPGLKFYVDRDVELKKRDVDASANLIGTQNKGVTIKTVTTDSVILLTPNTPGICLGTEDNGLSLLISFQEPDGDVERTLSFMEIPAGQDRNVIRLSKQKPGRYVLFYDRETINGGGIIQYGRSEYTISGKALLRIKDTRKNKYRRKKERMEGR
jgi:hypothetical protein